MKNAILRFALLYVIELVVFFLAIGIYNYFFKLERGNISLGITYHYYTLMVYPTILFICNLAAIIVKNDTARIIAYIFSIITVLVYWLDVFKNYPFRTLFVLFISIIILLGGILLEKLLLKK